MTPHNPAFVKAIKANPEDDQPRLIYADWLEELQTEGSVAWADFIRLSIMQYRASEKLFKGVQVPEDGAEMWRARFLLGCCQELRTIDAFMGRESHDVTRCPACLMGRQSSQFLKMDKDDTEPNQNWYSGSVWERGFIKELGLHSVTGFQKAIPPYLERHPIQRITFLRYNSAELHINGNIHLYSDNPAFREVLAYCQKVKPRGVVYSTAFNELIFSDFENFCQIFSDALLDYFRGQGIV